MGDSVEDRERRHLQRERRELYRAIYNVGGVVHNASTGKFLKSAGPARPNRRLADNDGTVEIGKGYSGRPYTQSAEGTLHLHVGG